MIAQAGVPDGEETLPETPLDDIPLFDEQEEKVDLFKLIETLQVTLTSQSRETTSADSDASGRTNRRTVGGAVGGCITAKFGRKFCA